MNGPGVPNAPQSKIFSVFNSDAVVSLSKTEIMNLASMIHSIRTQSLKIKDDLSAFCTAKFRGANIPHGKLHEEWNTLSQVGRRLCLYGFFVVNDDVCLQL